MSILLMALMAIETKAQPDPWVSGTHAGHDYADLGLPSGNLWATHNIGATAPEEYGDFFAWGEVEPKDWFVPDNYLYYTGEIIYDPNLGSWYEFVDIGDQISGTEYDAAVHLWGSGWRMPTEDDRYELTSRCWSNKIVEQNGVKGRIYCGPNENSIFIPAAGAGPGPGSQYECPEGRSAVLWIGDISDRDFPKNIDIDSTYVPFCALCMLYDEAGYKGNSRGYRYTGKNIRPVYNPKEDTGILSVSSDKNIAVSYRNGSLIVLGLSSSATAKICDMSGRTCQSLELDKSSTHAISLPCGLYIVNILNDSGLMATKKIAIKE